MAALPCMHKYTCVFIVVSLDLCLYHLYHPLEKARGGVSASFPPLGRQLETLETFERVPQIHANPTPKDQHCPASIGICSTNQTWTSTSSLGCWQGEPGNWSDVEDVGYPPSNDIPKGGNGKLTWEGSRFWESLLGVPYIIPRSRELCPTISVFCIILISCIASCFTWFHVETCTWLPH